MTNIPTPYRLPLWSALDNILPVQIACMAASEPNRSWDGARLLADAGALNLAAPRVRVSHELCLYLPNAELRRLLARRWDGVVIDGWESPAYLYVQYVARKRGIPVVLYYRGTTFSQRFRRGPIDWLRRRSFQAADSILTGGEPSTTAVLSLEVPRTRIVEGVVPLALGVEPAPHVRRSDHSDGHRFLMIGQLIARKNPALVVRAFHAVRAPQDTLTIVGEGPLEAEIRQLIAELGIDHDVQLLGHMDPAELDEHYAEADTLVLASSREVYGLVVGEALARGLHAVVTRACGVSADVAGMRGAYVVDVSMEAVAAGMRTSRKMWSGAVTNPQVVAHTPESAAHHVEQALVLARQTREARRR